MTPAEVAALLIACGVLFFRGLDRFPFIETEGLRAIVVQEMRQRPGLSFPTVHGAPYLRKPPLYAWTTTALSRAVGRFDERVARLPSAVSATLLVLIVYLAGRRWLGSGGGIAAAVLLLANSTVLDYGFRAELDMPFALLTTVALLAAFAALHHAAPRACSLGPFPFPCSGSTALRDPSNGGKPPGLKPGARDTKPGDASERVQSCGSGVQAGECAPGTGARRGLKPAARGGNDGSAARGGMSESVRRDGTIRTMAWLVCYAAALAASLWKGPHALIFLGLALAAYGWTHARWDWLRQPGHVRGLTACLGALVAWSILLSRFAGPAAVGKTAAVELFQRLVPHSVNGVVGIFLFLPVTVIVTIPASLFIIASLIGVRASRVRVPPPGDAPGPDAGPNRDRARDRPPPERAEESRPSRPRAPRNALRSWCDGISPEPLVRFIAISLAADLLFLMIAPVKAPRYSLPLFGLIALLAAGCALGGGTRPPGDARRSRLDALWRGIHRVLTVLGVASALMALVAAWTPKISDGHSMDWGSARTWLPLALACLVVRLAEARQRPRDATFRRFMGLLLVVVAAKPIMMDVWWPARAAPDDMRGPARRVDRIVPEGAPVFILKKDDAPDVAFYSHRTFRWIADPAEAGSVVSGAHAYFLVRARDWSKYGIPGSRQDFTTLFTFIRNGRAMILFSLDPRSLE